MIVVLLTLVVVGTIWALGVLGTVRLLALRRRDHPLPAGVRWYAKTHAPGWWAIVRAGVPLSIFGFFPLLLVSANAAIVAVLAGAILLTVVTHAATWSMDERGEGAGSD